MKTPWPLAARGILVGSLLGWYGMLAIARVLA